MEKLVVFWLAITSDIRKKFGRFNNTAKHTPVANWRKPTIVEFLSHFEEEMNTILAKSDESTKQLCGLKSKKGYLALDYTNFRKIFITKESKGRPATQNSFAIYLGYNSAESYLEYFRLFSALEDWEDQVLEHSKWNPVQLILDYQLSKPELYQPIYLTPMDRKSRLMTYEAGEVREFQLSQGLYIKGLEAISIHSLLTKITPWSILIGIPGSGKTSSLKWLLQQVVQKTQQDYDQALYVSLASLDEFLQYYPKASLFTAFFYLYLDYDFEQAESIGLLLEQKITDKDYNCLFLMDGLDEVDPERRNALVKFIYKTLSKEKVIITSRPSASNNLFSLSASSFYDIAALPPASIRSLVTIYCKVSENYLLSDEILLQLSNNIGLQKIAVTPYVLIVICEIISYQMLSRDIIPLHQSNLFEKLVKLIQQDYNRKNQYPFEEKHIEVLVRFAERLSFLSGVKTIKGKLPKGNYNQESLVRARFLNQGGLHLDKFEFVHLRLQEYFTALGIAKRSVPAFEKFINEKAFDPEWMEVTRFLVGTIKDTKSAQIFSDTLKKQIPWISKELTGNAWYRLAKIQSAKGVSLRGTDELGVDLYQVLLNFILQIHSLYIQYIEILLESDGQFFIKDLMRYDPLVQVWENVYRLTPISLRNSSGLLDLVKKPDLVWVKSMRGYGFLQETTLEHYRNVLRNWKSTSKADLIEAVQQIGIASDYESLHLLKPLIAESSVVSANAAVALARIGGAEAACILAKTLISPDKSISEKTRRRFADALQIGRFQAIEPQSKELLCDWFCVQKAPYPEYLGDVLFVLSNIKLNIQTTTKVVSMLLDTNVAFDIKAQLLRLIPSVQDEENIHLLFQATLKQEVKLPLSTIDMIAYIPLKSTSLLPILAKKMELCSEREKLSYLSLLLKSYQHYPRHPKFAFILEILEKTFTVASQNTETLYHKVKLWQKVDGYDLGISFVNLALRDLLSDSNSLALKSAALQYLDGLFYTLTPKEILDFKEQLTLDQSYPELRAYVKSALTYLLIRTPNDGSKLIAYIRQNFHPENKSFFTDALIKEAGVSGYLILAN